jgi:hypothetical protein
MAGKTADALNPQLAMGCSIKIFEYDMHRDG